jgi:phosphopantothenoylcysteine decarboxylase/phosphopantothenate--cysteine ligase
VTLLAAAIEVPLPEGARVLRVESTDELGRALDEAMTGDVDALVMAAAVADFTPAAPSKSKIGRAGGLSLELRPTKDLIGALGAKTATLPAGDRPVLVAFAAETGNLDRAAGKLAAKQVDLVVANDVSEEGSGFGTDTNRVTILDRGGGREELPLLTKREVADRILDRVAAALDGRDGAAQTAGVQRAGGSR